jgi:hypothetical protein
MYLSSGSKPSIAKQAPPIPASTSAAVLCLTCGKATRFQPARSTTVALPATPVTTYVSFGSARTHRPWWGATASRLSSASGLSVWFVLQRFPGSEAS